MAERAQMPPLWLAHDHMDRPEDFDRDLGAGVTGKILHMVVDSWFDAPTREQYEESYYGYDGFVQRALAAAARVLSQAADPASHLRIVRTAADLDVARETGALGLVLGSEGAKLIEEDLGLLEAFWHLGLRHIQLNWAMRNQIGASQSNEEEPEQPGLTPFGFSVVERMNELGMVIDVSHSAPSTISDVLGTTSKPILNSHSGSRAIAPKPQNLRDEQIRAMADNGGVVAIHFCSRLVLGGNERQATIDDLVRQFRYVSDVGGIDIVGLGPDWVLGNHERAERYLRNTDQESITWTAGLESSEELPNLLPALERGGFGASEIQKIFGGNLLRLFRDVLPA